jgi:hypothetical protein
MLRHARRVPERSHEMRLAQVHARRERRQRQVTGQIVVDQVAQMRRLPSAELPMFARRPAVRERERSDPRTV